MNYINHLHSLALRQLYKTVVLLGIILIFMPLSAQKQEYYFEHLGTDEGLSMANVIDIVRDQHGFIWIGTEDGLNRYDGYQFTVYYHDAEDDHSLTNSYIETLLIDSQNRLWVGTRDGMNLYIPEKDYFIRYASTLEKPYHIASPDIKKLFEDSIGNLWIVGEAGLECMLVDQDTIIHYQNDPEDPTSFSSNTAYDMTEDSKGRLWIATENGLNMFDPTTEQFKQIFADPGNPYGLGSSYIRTILMDEKDNLWIGTYEVGLQYYDVQKNRFYQLPYEAGRRNALSHYQVNGMAFHWDGNLWVATTEGLNFIEINENRPQNSRIHQYLEDPNNPNSISATHIQRVLVEESGIWFATRFGGVNYYDQYGSKFLKNSSISTDGSGLSHLNVTNFTEDNSGRIYVGTDGGGVNIFNPATGKFRYLKHRLNDPNSISSDKVLSLLFEAPNTLWIGMWGGGLNRYDIQTGIITRYWYDPDDPSSISNDNVFSLFLDHNKDLWVGTWSSGLNKYNRSADSFTRYTFNQTDGTGTSGESIISMYEDHQKRLWLAQEGQGLNYFNREENRFIYYQNNPDDSTTISGDYVVCVLEDSQGRFWLTTTNGLNLFNPETEEFTSFHKEDGLPAQTLYGILEDEQGNLWVSSIQGLSKVVATEVDGKTNIQCTNYSSQDGLQGEQYGQWSYFKTRDGMMYFGGLNGFNRFDPNAIQKNPVAPKVLINDFQLSMKPVSFLDPDSPLKKPIYLTEEMKISHKESMLTFGFVGISFTQQENNQYAYILENFDEKDDWHYVGTEHKATYTNLDPGKYVFRVKAANNDGIWTEEGASLKITIPPPFYQRAWFILFVILVGLTAAYVTYKWRVGSLEAHRQKLEKEISERTAELKAKSDEIEASYKKLSETGAALASSSRFVNQATEQINEAMHEVKDGARSQSDFVARTRATIDNLLATIYKANSETKTSAKAAEITAEAVIAGTASMQDTLDNIGIIEESVNETWEIMKGLIEHSEHIDQIVRFIDDIASRVNILAMNALIEAVKAGDSGKGFMVVAQEIRNLSKRTAESTFEITEFIQRIQIDVSQMEKTTKQGLENVRKSAELTDKGRKVLDQICNSVEDEKKRLLSIASRVNEMQKFSGEVQVAIDSVASVSERNRVTVEKVNANTLEVGTRIEKLAVLAQSLNVHQQRNN
ncbi:hypothetical protein HQ585_18125 [candidate division KSB1 bacterium]|nr:hypothetical protein [candidate division KSB1 bacterium]